MPERMTISAGLRRINKLKGQISTYKQRVQAALVYREDQTPAFSFEESMRLLEDSKKQLIKLSTAIALKNAVVNVDWNGQSVSIAGALRILQELKDELSWLGHISVHSLKKDKATEEVEFVPDFSDMEIVDLGGGRVTERPRRKEVKHTITCHITISQHAERIEKLQEQFEKLNGLVESSNHITTVEIGD